MSFHFLSINLFLLILVLIELLYIYLFGSHPLYSCPVTLSLVNGFEFAPRAVGNLSLLLQMCQPSYCLCLLVIPLISLVFPMRQPKLCLFLLVPVLLFNSSLSLLCQLLLSLFSPHLLVCCLLLFLLFHPLPCLVYLPFNTHTMLTRSKTGHSKPKAFHVSTPLLTAPYLLEMQLKFPSGMMI